VFDRGDKDGICGIFNRGGAIRTESFIPRGYRERVYEVFVGSGLFERLESAGYLSYLYFAGSNLLESYKRQ